MFPEQSIIGARASVMIYDEGLKKWIPSGNSSGLSKVQIFHHIQNNTFRVVGRKLQDHEVVINCSIVKGLKYNQATATFHQWRDSKFVYGLNFSSQQDAENFARAMMHTLEVLSGRAVSVPANAQTNQQHAPQQQQQQQPHPQQNSYDEDMGYRTMTREDADMLNQNQPQQIMSPQTPTSQTMGVQHQQGHHRASSAPQAPQMPPTMSVMSQQQQQPPQMQNYPIQSLQQQQQQFPIYASGTSQQMNLQPQNGVPIYVPSSISIQNSLNNVATKPAPVPPPIQNNINNTYGHGMMQQPLQTQLSQPPIPQYAPSLQQQVSIPGAPAPPPAPPSGFGNNIPCPPPAPNNNISSGIPCPPPAPMNVSITPNNNSSGSSAAPPPPPPLPNGGAKSGGMDMGSLAAQLQQAKLRKTSAPQNQSSANENSGNSTSSSSSGNYGTIGRTGGNSSSGGGGEMASMMDEMAKTLARRRERQKDTNTQDGDNDKWEKSNTLPHKLSSSNSQTLPSSSSSNAASSLADSPQSRKRFGSASEETILKQVNGGDFSLPPAFDMKAFKADILKEMRSEITKAKNEIIDAIKVELNRRR